MVERMESSTGVTLAPDDVIAACLSVSCVASSSTPPVSWSTPVANDDCSPASPGARPVAVAALRAPRVHRAGRSVPGRPHGRMGRRRRCHRPGQRSATVQHAQPAQVETPPQIGARSQRLHRGLPIRRHTHAARRSATARRSRLDGVPDDRHELWERLVAERTAVRSWHRRFHRTTQFALASPDGRDRLARRHRPLPRALTSGTELERAPGAARRGLQAYDRPCPAHGCHRRHRRQQ
jgi:hypothetical protein